MNTNRAGQRIFVSIFALILLLAFPTVAFATDIKVTADSTSVKVGDTVTLTVTVSADHIAVANGVFTYDPALLSYISSNGGASDGIINMVAAQKGGASSLTAVIKFAAIGQGDAVVNVSMDSVLSYDEQALDAAQAGVSISVAASDTAPADPNTEQSTPPLNLSQTGVAAQNVDGAKAQMYIWRSLSNLTLPAGYVDKQVTYNGEYVGGAAIPDSEDILLLYLSEETGENAGYYIYDAQKNTLFPYITMLSVAANYTIMSTDETVVVPAGYEKTTFVWKEKEVPAWAAPGSDGSVYLVYVRNAAGEKGLFLFNVKDESMQRYLAPSGAAPSVQPTAAPSQEPASTPVVQTDASQFSVDRTLFYVICGACALLAAGVIVLVILYTSKTTRNKRRAARWEKKNYAATHKEDNKS